MNNLTVLNKLVEETEDLIGAEAEDVKTTEYTRFTKKYALAFENDATLFRDLRMLFVNLKAHNIKLDFNAVLQVPASFIEDKQFEMITFPTISLEDLERAVKNTKFRVVSIDEPTVDSEEEEEEEVSPEDEEAMASDAGEEEEIEKE